MQIRPDSAHPLDLAMQPKHTLSCLGGATGRRGVRLRAKHDWPSGSPQKVAAVPRPLRRQAQCRSAAVRPVSWTLQRSPNRRGSGSNLTGEQGRPTSSGREVRAPLPPTGSGGTLRPGRARALPSLRRRHRGRADGEQEMNSRWVSATSYPHLRQAHVIARSKQPEKFFTPTSSRHLKTACNQHDSNRPLGHRMCCPHACHKPQGKDRSPRARKTSAPKYHNGCYSSELNSSPVGPSISRETASQHYFAPTSRNRHPRFDCLP